MALMEITLTIGRNSLSNYEINHPQKPPYIMRSYMEPWKFQQYKITRIPCIEGILSLCPRKMQCKFNKLGGRFKLIKWPVCCPRLSSQVWLPLCIHQRVPEPPLESCPTRPSCLQTSFPFGTAPGRLPSCVVYHTAAKLSQTTGTKRRITGKHVKLEDFFFKHNYNMQLGKWTYRWNVGVIGQHKTRHPVSSLYVRWLAR